MPQLNEFSWIFISFKITFLMMIFLVSSNLLFHTMMKGKSSLDKFFFSLI